MGQQGTGGGRAMSWHYGQGPGGGYGTIEQQAVWLRLGGQGREPEPVFLNVYGAPESIPRNEFR